MALIGDSFVEGFQLFGRAHFGRLLEMEPALSDRRVEVLNFGMSGLDLEDMAIVQATLVDDFSPDYTLFFVRDSDFSLAERKVNRAFFRVSPAGLVIDSTFTESRWHQLERHPAVRVLERSALLSLIRRGSAAARIELARRSPGGGEQDLDFPKLTSGARPRWDVVSRVLERLATPSHESTNIVITWEALQPDAEAALRRHQLDRWRLDDSLERLAAAGLDPEWWPISGRKGHWNRHAHRAIAAALAVRLSRHAPAAR